MTTHTADHSIPFAGNPQIAFNLLSDVSLWPLAFGPCVHAEVLWREGKNEQIRLWATVGDTVNSWTSSRHVDHDTRTISFQQDVSPYPLASMSGQWKVEPDRVFLNHQWQLREGALDKTDWIREALDTNSEREVRDVNLWAQSNTMESSYLQFEESADLASPAAAVYHALMDADRWPDFIPHVAAAATTPIAPQLESGDSAHRLDMQTSDGEGEVHETSSIRIAFNKNRIIYKQLNAPGALRAHVGQWAIEPRGEESLVTVSHGVVLDHDVLGRLRPGASVDSIRKWVRTTLSNNSLETLQRISDCDSRTI